MSLARDRPAWPTCPDDGVQACASARCPQGLSSSEGPPQDIEELAWKTWKPMGWRSPSGQCWCRLIRTQRGPAPPGTESGKQGLVG